MKKRVVDTIYTLAYIIASPVFHVLYRIKIRGRENIPKGAALVCANHSAYKDPVMAAMAITFRSRLRFMIKRELYDVKGLNIFLAMLDCIPVHRGEADLTAIRRALEELKAGNKVLIFPEGSRVSEGEQAGAKLGAAMLAMRSGAPVLPVYITSGPKKMFSRIDVVIGKPFLEQKTSGAGSAEKYGGSARRILDGIYALAPREDADV